LGFDIFSLESLIGVMGIVIGTIFAIFGPTGKYIGERRYGAEKRANIVHKQLIGDLGVVISTAEKADSFQFVGRLHDSRYASLLLSNKTRKKISEVVEAKKGYSGARNTCIKITELILRKELHSHLKETERKIKEKELWKGKGYGSLESLFTNNVSAFLQRAIKERDINIEWFKELISLSYWDEIKETIEKGESLERFLTDVNSELKRDPATQWLKEERDNLLTLSKECREMLELESRKLYSWKDFFYGWGKKTIIEDLEKGLKEIS